MKFRLNDTKMLELNTLMIQIHLLRVQIQWMTFMKILMITIQTEKQKS